MKFFRIWLLAAIGTLASVCLPTTAVAQGGVVLVPAVGYVAMTGSALQDSTGALVANATISFAPTNCAGAALSYQVNGHGQSTQAPVTALVTNGAFSLQLADTVLAWPHNVGFAVTVTDNVSGASLLGPGYGCVQPAGSGTAVTGSQSWCMAATSTMGGACNFDSYKPNLAALVVTQAGPTGATGLQGASAITGMTGDGAGNASLTGQFSAGAVAASVVNAVVNADTQTASDCGEKITAALALLSVGPGIVQFSPACGTITTDVNLIIPRQQLQPLPGDYSVNSPDPIRLTGSGTSIKCLGVSAESPGAHGGCIFKAADGSNLSSVIAMAGFGSYLSNIVTDGNKAAVANPSEVGVSITATRAVLEHVSVTAAPSHGIKLVGAAGSVIQSSWTLQNGGSGVWSNGTGDVFIQRSEFEQDCQSEINATNGSNAAWRITQSDIAGAMCHTELSGTAIPVQWWDGIDLAGFSGAWMISGTQFAEHFDGLSDISGLVYPYDAYLQTINGNSVVGGSRYLNPWVAGTFYLLGDAVTSSNMMCQSLIAGNSGNTPATSPGAWVCVSQNPVWSDINTYNVGDRVAVGLNWCSSLTAGNIGNPVSSSANWSCVPQVPVFNAGATYNVGQVAWAAGIPWTSIAAGNTGHTPILAVQGTNYQTTAGLGYWVPSVLGTANGFHFYGGGSNTVTGNNCFRESGSSNQCVRNDDAYVAGIFPYHNIASTIQSNVSQTWSGSSFTYAPYDIFFNADNYGTLPTQSAPVLANGKAYSIQNSSGMSQKIVSMDNIDVVHVVGDSVKRSVLLGGNQAAGQLNLLYQPTTGVYIDAVPMGVQFLLQSSSSGFGSYFLPLGTGTSTTPIYFPVNVPAAIPATLAATPGNCVTGLSNITAAFTTASCLTEPGFYDSSTLTANLTNTLIPGMSSTPSGYYELHCYAVATNAATAGTLPLCGYYYVDADTGVLVIGAVGSSKTTSAIGDNTYSAGANVRSAYIKGGTTVQGYTLNYAAGSGTALQYVVHFRVVRVGA